MSEAINGLELRGEIVVPGDVLGKGGRRGEFTYMNGDLIKSAVFGVKNESDGHISVIPLAGRYTPKEGDMVVGVVTDVMRTGWLVDMGAGYTGYLNKEKRRDDDFFDLRKLFKEGDILSVKISRVDEVKSSYVDGPRRLTGGRIVIVNAKKVPRIIGSKKSMLRILREKSGCRILVGQNGIIWIDGPERAMEIVVEAILKIEQESHTKGLTDRMSIFMDENMKGVEKGSAGALHESGDSDEFGHENRGHEWRARPPRAFDKSKPMRKNWNRKERGRSFKR